MQRVTGMDAHHWPMDDDKETRFGLWKRGLLAESHALIKSVGGVVDARWLVSNLGSAPGSARLILTNVLGGVEAVSTTVSIAPGVVDVALILLWTIPSTSPTGVRSLTLTMQDVTGGGAAVIGSHTFTVTVSPLGPSLVASAGGPTIN